MGGMNSGSASELETLLRYLYIQANKPGAQPGSASTLGGGVVTSTASTLNYTVNVGLAGSNGSVGYLIVDFPCVMQQAVMIADQSGYATVDLLKCQFGQLPNTLSITGGDYLACLNTQSVLKTDLSNWTIVLSAGDILEFRVTGIVSITRLSIGIKILR